MCLLKCCELTQQHAAVGMLIKYCFILEEEENCELKDIPLKLALSESDVEVFSVLIFKCRC
jgi:hypothetical protein